MMLGRDRLCGDYGMCGCERSILAGCECSCEYVCVCVCVGSVSDRGLAFVRDENLERFLFLLRLG